MGLDVQDENVEKVTKELSGLCSGKCIKRCSECTESLCKEEARKIAESYVKRVLAIRKPNNNKGDIRCGWKCYQWAGLIQRDLAKLNLKCWSILWVGYVIEKDPENNGKDSLEHNFVNASVGGALDKSTKPQKDCSLILDPWRSYGDPTVYQPDEWKYHKWNYIHDLETNEGAIWDGKKWVDAPFEGPWTPAEPTAANHQ